MNKLLTKNQYTVLENTKIGDKIRTSDLYKLMGLKSGQGTSHVFTELARRGYFKALYRERRNICWERIK